MSIYFSNMSEWVLKCSGYAGLCDYSFITPYQAQLQTNHALGSLSLWSNESTFKQGFTKAKSVGLPDQAFSLLSWMRVGRLLDVYILYIHTYMCI